MSTRVKIEFGGEEVDADDLGFVSDREEWNSYTAEDGTIIKLKHVTAKIYKLVGKTKEDGSPMYVVSGTALLTTTVPSSEKPKPVESTEEKAV